MPSISAFAFCGGQEFHILCVFDRPSAEDEGNGFIRDMPCVITTCCRNSRPRVRIILELVVGISCLAGVGCLLRKGSSSRFIHAVLVLSPVLVVCAPRLQRPSHPLIQ